jgi:hypothetical protein
MNLPRIRIRGPVKRTSTTAERGAVEYVEEQLLIRELVRIAFFVPHDHFDIAAGVAHALDAYVRAVEGGAQALSRYVCCYWEQAALDDRGWELIRESLAPKERRYIDDYKPHESFYPLKDGADPYFAIHGQEESGYYFGYYARLPWRDAPPERASVLVVTLPTEFLEERGPGFVRELALDMSSRLPFASGHAGLAIKCRSAVHEEVERLRPFMFRYPGFDLRAADIRAEIDTRVDGIHWMNFLGQPVLGQLGGSEGLRARLRSPSTVVQHLEGGRALVTLGPHPEAGDLTTGDTLPAYRELARLLEPWLEPVGWGFLGPGDRPAEEEDLRRWFRRFLG